MKTVGRLLDTEKAQKLMDQYFERITFYSKSHRELPARIRFMLKDVIELRDNKWVPRRVQKETGPKTIGQIREEAAKDLGLPNSFWVDSSNLMGASGIPGIVHPHFGFMGQNRGIYGQPRSLDDLSYFSSGAYGLGTGPGVIPEGISLRNSSNQTGKRGNNLPASSAPPLNPMLQPGYIPQAANMTSFSRGQGTRDSNKSNGGQRMKQDQMTANRSNPNLPPRLQPKNQPLPVNMIPGLADAILMAGRGQLPHLNPDLVSNLSKNIAMTQQPLDGKDISLRPSMPVLKPNVTNAGYIYDSHTNKSFVDDAPFQKSSRGSPIPDANGSSLTKDASNINFQQPNQREIILKRAEEVIEKLNEDQTDVGLVVSKLKDLKIPKK